MLWFPHEGRTKVWSLYWSFLSDAESDKTEVAVKLGIPLP